MSDNPEKCEVMELGSGNGEEDPEVDSRHLLGVFPEIVWKKILERVTEPETLESLNSASAFFKTRLLDKRTLFLFPKVWPVLYQTLETQFWKDFQDLASMDDVPLRLLLEAQGYEDCSACGKTRAPRPFTGILKLRQVCKAWRTGVDAFCQKQASEDFGTWSVVNLERPSVVQALLKHFEETHGTGSANPFLGRAITLNWDFQDPYNNYLRVGEDIAAYESDGSEDVDVYSFLTPMNDTDGGSEWEDAGSLTSREEEDFLDDATLKQFNIQVMLQKYGVHVWHCSISLYDRGEPSRDCYLWLTTMLSLMPNLKTLEIDFRENIYVRGDRSRWKWNVEDFPKLEQLEFLSVDGLCGGLLKGILDKNGHLERLQLGRYLKGMDFGFGILSPVSTYLTCLTLRIPSSEDFEALMNLENDWPLEELTLYFDEFVETPWPEILNGIGNKWADTLTNLDIELPGSSGMSNRENLKKNDPELKLSLPKLKRLRVDMTTYRWLDFLLPVKDTLEYLHASVTLESKLLGLHDKRVIPRKILQVLGKTRQVLELLDVPVTSNIWEVMPKLKRIHLSENYYENGHCLNQRSFHGQQTRKEWANGKEFKWANSIIY